MTRSNRADELLDHAQRMVQQRGFNAFSYADLAKVTGIRTASIHYHFKSKAELGRQLMERYTRGLTALLERLDEEPALDRRLLGFIDAYRQTQASGAICLCGSMASDAETLDEATRTVISRYVKTSRDWVERTIQHGVGDGVFRADVSAEDEADSLVSALQGALIMGRASQAMGALDAVERRLMKSLRA